jgi:hypothetical protein
MQWTLKRGVTTSLPPYCVMICIVKKQPTKQQECQDVEWYPGFGYW